MFLNKYKKIGMISDVAIANKGFLAPYPGHDCHI